VVANAVSHHFLNGVLMLQVERSVSGLEGFKQTHKGLPPASSIGKMRASGFFSRVEQCQVLLVTSN
jgi:hypothetical protein